jgi:hypothetical protein
MRIQVLLLVGIGAIAAACGRQPAPAPLTEAPAAPPAERTSGTGPIAASFRHVNLQVADGIVLEISRLDGALVGTRPGATASFDDPRSFTVRIDSGEVALSPRSLSNLMNSHVFAYEGAPLKNLELSIESGHLKQKGTLHKGIDMPFSVVAEVSVTTAGRIRLHPLSVKVLGIPSVSLMKLFGIDLGGVIKLKESSGVEIDGNDFLLAPDRLLASPAITGRLTGIRVEADRLVELFGPPHAATPLVPPDRTARNFLYFRGGTLRFGRLTMSDADLDIVDDARGGAFAFSLPHYMEQLVAGYSKTTQSGGLVAHMSSYHAPVTPLSRPPAPR